MERGVSQLLFSYLPGRVVDWEDGLAIVELTSVNFSEVWGDGRATTLFGEIGEYIRRWTARGGRVHRELPDPSAEPHRFVVGLPASISARPYDTALVCGSCGTVQGTTLRSLRGSGGAIRCEHCGAPGVRQYGQVFVHGCGEMVPLRRTIPVTRNGADGNIELTDLPLRCPRCGPQSRIMIPPRAERVRDIRVVCGRCNVTVIDRLTARCHACFRDLRRAPSSEVAGSEATPEGPTVLGRIAMRMTRYTASEAYYAHTLTILRKDRPRISERSDDELAQLLPLTDRPSSGNDRIETISHLSRRLSEAQQRGDSAETARLLSEIARVASASASGAPEVARVSGLSAALMHEVEESISFRLGVERRSAFDLSRDGVSGLTHHAGDLLTRATALGIKHLDVVGDLPIISATFAYTRRSFLPKYDEPFARELSTSLRPFPAFQDRAAQRLNRPDLAGRVPIIAREGEHEAIYIGLDPQRVIEWLERNGLRLAFDRTPLQEMVFALEPVDRFYDTIWTLELRRYVFGLIHTLAHAAMKAVSRFAGIDRTSLGEYVFLPLLGFCIFDNSSAFRMGRIESLARDNLAAFLNSLIQDDLTCIYDTDCIDRTGACHGCVHSPEIACRVFNHGLSRAFLMGGHTPWAAGSGDGEIVGFWQA